MREVKKNCPSSVCNLQYDKLYVNHRCYVWSDTQGRVVQYSPVSNRCLNKYIKYFQIKDFWLKYYLKGDELAERSLSRTRSLSSIKAQAASPAAFLVNEDEEDGKDEQIKQLMDLVSALKTEIVALKASNPNTETAEEESNE